MRKCLSIAAVIVFAVGFAWRFAGWISEWTGRLLGTRGVTSSYEAFVESHVGMYLAEGGFARIAGPWLLMAAGLILLFILWASPRKSQHVG